MRHRRTAPMAAPATIRPGDGEGERPSPAAPERSRISDHGEPEFRGPHGEVVVDVVLCEQEPGDAGAKREERRRQQQYPADQEKSHGQNPGEVTEREGDGPDRPELESVSSAVGDRHHGGELERRDRDRNRRDHDAEPQPQRRQDEQQDILIGQRRPPRKGDQKSVEQANQRRDQNDAKRAIDDVGDDQRRPAPTRPTDHPGPHRRNPLSHRRSASRRVATAMSSAQLERLRTPVPRQAASS